MFTKVYKYQNRNDNDVKGTDMKKMKTIEERPKQKYARGEREVLSLRLHSDLINRIKKEADKKNYSTTEIVEMVFDMYFQIEDVKG